MPIRLDPASWRAALWALRAKRRCHRTGSSSGVPSVVLPEVPVLPDRARRAVLAALARSRSSCLERATVLQAWDLAHHHIRDIVIGVTKPSEGFRAHAWLDGDEGRDTADFTELLRLPPGVDPSTRQP